MRRTTLAARIAILALWPAVLFAAADEKTAEEALKSKGLRKLSTVFSVPQESELTKKMHDAEVLKKKVRDLQTKLQDSEKAVDTKQKTIVAYLQQRRELRTRLQAAPNPTVHNQIVSLLNELADRIQLMEQDEKPEKALREARAAATQGCEEYTEFLLATRKLFDSIKEKYADLAADAAVAGAIADYSKATGKTFKLGPGAGFLASGKRLSKLEDTVLSQSIDLQKGHGDLWMVTISINGKAVSDVAIDTGASLVCLPWKTAKDVGLQPNSEADTVQLKLADGHIVEAKEVTADTIRLGKFTIEKVRCAVLPEKLTDTEPVLGLTFLKNFVYKIDTTGNKLVISKVEVAEPSGKPSGGSKKGPAAE
jgi:clan AA aspartic protease (TIGR02281 family)